jgi:hypothetical protein
MRRLQVRPAGYTSRGEAIVHFFRRGTGYYPCLVCVAAARNDNYLRSLVEFMQFRVPQPR